jgi:hypothetical protein
MAASVFQERNSENTGGSTTISLAFSGNNVAGNATHVAGYGVATVASATFTDSNNSYTLGTVDLVHDSSSAVSFFQSAAFNIAGGANTVGLTISPSAPLGIWIREIQGTASTGPDAHTINLDAGTTTTHTTTMTLVAAGALASAIGCDFNNGQATSVSGGWTAGLTTGWTAGNALACAASESLHFTSAGSQTVASFTITGTDTFQTYVMSFADSAGGGSSTASIAWTV